MLRLKGSWSKRFFLDEGMHETALGEPICIFSGCVELARLVLKGSIQRCLRGGYFLQQMGEAKVGKSGTCHSKMKIYKVFWEGLATYPLPPHNKLLQKWFPETFVLHNFDVKGFWNRNCWDKCAGIPNVITLSSFEFAVDVWCSPIIVCSYGAIQGCSLSSRTMTCGWRGAKTVPRRKCALEPALQNGCWVSPRKVLRDGKETEQRCLGAVKGGNSKPLF